MEAIYIGVVIVIIVIVILCSNSNNFVEHFVSKFIPENYIIEDPSQLKPQRYINFLSTLNDMYISKTQHPMFPLRGAGVSKNTENEVIKAAYSTIPPQSSFKDECVEKANYLCEMTDPQMYLPETRYPPRWELKSLKDIPLPKRTDLACYNSNYSCCKNAN
jgi:hypothetical protein